MKKCGIRLLALLVACTCLPFGTTPAQVTQIGNQTVNSSTLVLVPPEAVPKFGSFFSVHRPDWPPLPGLPPAYAAAGVPVYWLGGHRYLVDDTLCWETIRAQQQLAQAAAMSALGSQQLDGDGGLSLMYSSYGSNDLWLELVAVTSQTAVLTIRSPVEDGVYDLFATTNLSANAPGLNLTNWLWLVRTNAGETTLAVPLLSAAEGYYVLGATNDTDADGLTDAFENLVSHSLSSTNDTDGDGMPDGWMWRHFGHATGQASDQTLAGHDYDGDGLSNGQEYSGGGDPNTIVFYSCFNSLRVSGDAATGFVTVVKGLPAKMAVLVDATNFAGATWTGYDPAFIATLGTTNGLHDVFVGLKGRAVDSELTWAGYRLTRDTVAPETVITHPAPGVVHQPMIQLRGYSPEPLASLRYDVVNGSGTWTNLEGAVVKQFVDTNTLEITTNWFACLDVELAAGTNYLALRATDVAGNLATTQTHYVFMNPTNAPVLNLIWPQAGDRLSGASFTLRGRLSDPTAQVAGQIIGGGVTNALGGIVERDGKFWVENLPLAAGTNWVTIAAVDAGTNFASTNFAVVQSDVELTMVPLDASVLNDATVTVFGTINVDSHKVWVNGMEVTNLSEGNWYVEGVPVNEGGTAVFEVRAIPLADNGGNGTGGSGGQTATFDNPGNPSSPSAVTAVTGGDKEPEVVLVQYRKSRSFLSLSREQYPTKKQTCESIGWQFSQPGHWFHDYCGGNTGGSNMYYEYSNRNWASNGVGTLYTQSLRGGPEVCGNQLYDPGTACTITRNWPGESCQSSGSRQFGIGSEAMDQVVARSARTLYELHTNGKAQSKRQRLFALTGDAEGVGWPVWPEDAENKLPYVIPKTNVVLGTLGRLNAAGILYKALADGETRDVTPTVSGNPYYTYSPPEPTPYTVKLYRLPSGEMIADTTNNAAVVGERIDLLCYLSPLTGPTITNYQWTVSQNTFSNYDVRADASTGLLYAAFATTNDKVQYYWVDGGRKDVECEATVAGEVLTARATFQVLCPTADFFLTPRGSIGADTNYYLGDEDGWTTTPWLHLGNRRPGTEGMVFTFTNANLNGYTGLWEFFFVQVGRADNKQCISSNQTFCKWGITGLDTRYPFKWARFAGALHGELPDNPGMELYGEANEAYKGNQFEVYLMFKATSAYEAKEVPLKVASWSWHASAFKTNSSWLLVGPQYPASAVGSYTITFPQWTNNIGGTFSATNSAACQCP